MVHACTLSTQETEARRRSSWVKASLGYKMRTRLKKPVYWHKSIISALEKMRENSRLDGEFRVSQMVGGPWTWEVKRWISEFKAQLGLQSSQRSRTARTIERNLVSKIKQMKEFKVMGWGCSSDGRVLPSKLEAWDSAPDPQYCIKWECRGRGRRMRNSRLFLATSELEGSLGYKRQQKQKNMIHINNQKGRCCPWSPFYSAEPWLPWNPSFVHSHTIHTLPANNADD